MLASILCVFIESQAFSRIFESFEEEVRAGGHGKSRSRKNRKSSTTGAADSPTDSTAQSERATRTGEKSHHRHSMRHSSSSTAHRHDQRPAENTMREVSSDKEGPAAGATHAAMRRLPHCAPRTMPRTTEPLAIDTGHWGHWPHWHSGFWQKRPQNLIS